MSAHLSYADAELLLRLAGRGKPIDSPDLPELYRLAREGYCKMDPCEVYRLTTLGREAARQALSRRVIV